MITRNFKGALYNIGIYTRANFGHEMGMPLNSCREVIIQQPEKPQPDTYESTKYICQLECNKYIVHLDNINQGLKWLLPILLGQ